MDCWGVGSLEAEVAVIIVGEAGGFDIVISERVRWEVRWGER